MLAALKLATAGNDVRVWVSDIIRVPPEQRTERDWGRLGVHHAQAMLARVAHNISSEKRELYLNCVIAATRHEERRMGGAKLRRYYCALHNNLDLALAVEESERGWIGPRIVA